jgi:hypothetical protein
MCPVTRNSGWEACFNESSRPRLDDFLLTFSDEVLARSKLHARWCRAGTIWYSSRAKASFIATICHQLKLAQAVDIASLASCNPAHQQTRFGVLQQVAEKDKIGHRGTEKRPIRIDQKCQ